MLRIRIWQPWHTGVTVRLAKSFAGAYSSPAFLQLAPTNQHLKLKLLTVFDDRRGSCLSCSLDLLDLSKSWQEFLYFQIGHWKIIKSDYLEKVYAFRNMCWEPSQSAFTGCLYLTLDPDLLNQLCCRSEPSQRIVHNGNVWNWACPCSPQCSIADAAESVGSFGSCSSSLLYRGWQGKFSSSAQDAPWVKPSI